MIAATYTPPNLGNLTTAPTRYHNCGPGGSQTFELDARQFTTVTASGTVATSVYKDLNTSTETEANTRTDYSVSVVSKRPVELGQKTVAVESSNTAVLGDPSGGVSQGVASGYTTLVARATNGEVSAVPVSVSIKTGGSFTKWTSAAEGSLNRHLWDQVDNLTAGKGRSSMQLWNKSTVSYFGSIYTWNPDCWGASIDNITCITPWNSATGEGGGGVLITPRHVLTCHHLGYHPKVGSQVRFVQPNGTQETFTVTAVVPHPYTEGWVAAPHDVLIYELDRDVGPSIKFAKVLPVDPSPYLPTIPRYIGDFILLNGNQSRPMARSCYASKDGLLATGFINTLPNAPYPNVRPGEPFWYEYSYYYVSQDLDERPTATSANHANPLGQQVWVGDSGKPAFVIINNELVVTNVWTGTRSGYALYTDATILNEMLATLGGGYQLTEVDLSEFPTY